MVDFSFISVVDAECFWYAFNCSKLFAASFIAETPHVLLSVPFAAVKNEILKSEKKNQTSIIDAWICSCQPAGYFVFD